MGTRLTERQRGLHRKESDVEVFAGAGVAEGDDGAPAQAIMEEFGNVNQAPHPSLRPAWEAEKMPALDSVNATMGEEIAAAAARARRKALRAGR